MKKIRSVTYKARDEVVGPRPWKEVRQEIISGALPRWTPLRFEDEGIWTDFEVVEKKEAGQNSFVVGIRGAIAALVFLNIVVLAVGYFHPGIFGLAGLGFLLLGSIFAFFERGPSLPDPLSHFIEIDFDFLHDRYTRWIVLGLYLEGVGCLLLFNLTHSILPQ